MSLFLGPIHHIMYNKIKFQEGLVDAIVRQQRKRLATMSWN